MAESYLGNAILSLDTFVLNIFEFLNMNQTAKFIVSFIELANFDAVSWRLPFFFLWNQKSTW